MCKKAAVAGLAQSLYDRLVMRLNMKPFRLEGTGTFHKLSRNLFNTEFVQQTKKPVKWISKLQLFYCLFCDKMSILDPSN